MTTHLFPLRRKGRYLARARRFRASTRGATAIEFAIVAPVLFVMLFGILEIAFFFFAGDILETATTNASRKLMTAQVQSLSSTDVCNELMVPGLFACGKLQVKVSSARCFSSLVASSGTAGSGAAGDAVMVETSYPWPGMGGLALALASAPKALSLRSVSVFRNPPADANPGAQTC
ncbi:MAG: pilus assembly protein [Alphaproteobacteria bacterium]|nr:pilus assembly protein [Alphaproteobacteria bacterium]